MQRRVSVVGMPEYGEYLLEVVAEFDAGAWIPRPAQEVLLAGLGAVRTKGDRP